MKITIKQYLLRNISELDENDSKLLLILKEFRKIHNQPERSKREDLDLHKYMADATNDGFIHSIAESIADDILNQRCGALNSMET